MNSLYICTAKAADLGADDAVRIVACVIENDRLIQSDDESRVRTEWCLNRLYVRQKVLNSKSSFSITHGTPAKAD